MSETSLTADASSPVGENHRHTDIGPGYRQTTVAVTGGRMTVGLWGPLDPGAPTILAVHGVSASHRSFGLLAQALPGVRVIAPDLRGRGRSSTLPGPYGMPVHADDLAAVLDHLAAQPVVVVGHSMGAFVTLVLAHRYPEWVSSAVLVDGGIPLKVPAGLDPDQVVQAVLGSVAQRLAMRFGSVEEYRRFWLEHPAFRDAWIPGSSTAALMEDYITYDLEPDGAALRPATRYEAMAQDTAELQGGGSLLEAIGQLAVPAHLLWSRRGLFNEEPGLFSADYITSWQDRVPALARNLAVTEVPATNHYSIVMAPDGARAVAEVITAGLGGMP
jgi:pimeloyl-ACP methyl ester carboxylesterase